MNKAETFVVGWLKNNPPAVDILNQNFIDAFVEATGAKCRIMNWGADKCPLAGKTLSSMCKSGILKRGVLGLGVNWQPGFPRWVYVYSLNNTELLERVMSDYPINSTARKFQDMDGNDVTLRQLIKREPEWAHSRILHLEQSLQEANSKLEAAELPKSNYLLHIHEDLFVMSESNRSKVYKFIRKLRHGIMP